MDEHHRWTLAGRLVDSDRAIRRVDFPRLHRPPPKETQTLQPGRPRIAVEAPRASPSESGTELKTCNIHKCISRARRVGPSAPPRTLPRIERRLRVSPMICPEINGPISGWSRFGGAILRPLQTRLPMSAGAAGCLGLGSQRESSCCCCASPANMPGGLATSEAAGSRLVAVVAGRAAPPLPFRRSFVYCAAQSIG